ncbi:MAG: hypothetical protein ACTSWM_00195 [Alphaproteobacteria bacterium]
MYQDVQGFDISTDSGTAAKALSAAIVDFNGWKVGAMPRLEAALDADAGCAMAQTLRGLFLHLARDVRLAPQIGAALSAAKGAAGSLTPREDLYIRALEASQAGRLSSAIAAYEVILAAHPTDLLAQRLIQSELFWLGEMGWSADVSARIAPAWDANQYGYGIHLSCRAFDLEETGHFEAAEKLARQAVEIDSTDAWGTHAVAHVMIMEGRFSEGVRWLEGLKDNWGETNQIALHLWWHRCLFHLELGEIDALLEIYDAWVRNRDLPLTQGMPDLYIDMQNGASMLLRLELCGIDVGGRWDELAVLAAERLDDFKSPFTAAHLAAILAAAGRFDDAETLVANMTAFAKSHIELATLAPRAVAAAVPAARAAIAHRRGDYGEVINQMWPARRMLWQIGGSHAQRDLFFLLMADAARRTERPDVLALIMADAKAAGFIDPEARVCHRSGAVALAL